MAEALDVSAETPPIEIQAAHWAIVSAVLQKHVPQYEVWAFGSRVKGTARAFSDLDLAIITETPLAIDVSAGLKEDFSESDLPWKVDVLDWASASESFRRLVEREKVVVQRASVKPAARGA